MVTVPVCSFVLGYADSHVGTEGSIWSTVEHSVQPGDNQSDGLIEVRR